MAVNSVRRNGSYAPLSAHYYKDDAIDEAGLAAELLYVRGLAFCADVLSDGFISDRQLVRFVGVGMDDAAERAKRLVCADLWEREEGGYRVRSWLTWNRSRDEITERQARDAQRKVKGRTSDSEPPPPEPPDDTPDPSERNPIGVRADSADPSESVLSDSTPRARAPLHSTPRNSTPRQEDSSSAAAAAATATPPREDVEQLCTRLRDRVEANGLNPPRITAEWRRQARLLLDTDKRDLPQALRLIDWCQSDPFWAPNVMSLPKFRKQYDQLLAKARHDQERRQGGRPPSRTTDDKRAAIPGLVAEVLGTSAVRPDLRALPGGAR